MTTVVYDSREKVMVSDRQMGWHKAPVDKIYRLNDGSLVGLAGGYAECLMALEWLDRDDDDETPKPEVEETTLIRITPDNDIICYTKHLHPLQVYMEYIAIGSGSEYAMGAMAQGATAEEAIAIAHMFDANTGAEIERVEL